MEAPHAAIRTERLSKSYGDVRALHELDLVVPQGDVFGFLGPNGAGKTTTIRLLLDLIRPSAGRAEVLGMDARERSLEVRARTGYLPGELALYEHMTGAELLRYFGNLRGVRGGRGEEVAERLGLDLSRRIGSLSKGNKQKVGLAQAFQHDPDLLILDEPTSGLDPLVQIEFLKMVREHAARGKTVFLSSHVLSEIEHIAHRVGIIRSGRLVVVEDVASLKARAVRRIELHFAQAPAQHGFASLANVRDVTIDGNVARFVVDGSVDALIKAAARFEVTDVVSHEPDLEEIFLTYYEVPMATEIARAAVRERRKGYIGWIVGIVLLSSFTFAFYPSVKDSGEIESIMDELPDSLRSFIGEKDLTSPEGYLESQLFLYMVPLLLFVFAIGQNADGIAGEEKRKTLDLLLAHPVPRRRVVLEKFGANVSGLIGLGAVLLVTVLLGSRAVDMDVSSSGLVAICLGCVLLAAFMGALSLAIAAATGKKTAAVATASAFATAAYFVNSLAPQIEALEVPQKVSPFYYYIGGGPILNGIPWGRFGVLLGGTLALLAVAIFTFDRRDIDV